LALEQIEQEEQMMPMVMGGFLVKKATRLATTVAVLDSWVGLLSCLLSR
jgi:hypothetical protein